jgi:hypothetical protein
MTRIVLALVLLSSPLSAWAACTGDSAEQAMSCVEGTMWDSEVNACVPVVMG